MDKAPKPLQRLLREHDTLKRELSLLQRCLAKKGVILDSDLHRLRFEDAQQRFGFSSSLRSLEQLMEIWPVAGNWPWWGQLRWASRSLHHNLCAVEAKPSKCLYVIGGAAGHHSMACAEQLGLSGVWEPLPDMPCAQARHAGAALGGSLYVCGGADPGPSNAVSRLDLASRSWAEVVPMRERRSWPVALALEGKLYVCGGWDGTVVLDSLEVLEPQEAEWRPLPAMASPRGAFAGVSLRGRLLAFGGIEDFELSSAWSAEAFSPEDNAWRPLPRMEQGCCGHAAAALKGLAFVCGGRCAGRPVTAVQIYHPAEDAWTRGPDMTRPRSGHAAAVLADKLYILGGKVLGDPDATDCVEVLDVEMGSWEAVAPLSQRRIFFCAAAALPSREP